MTANELRIGNNYQLEDGVLGGGIATIKNKHDLDIAFDLLESNLIKPIPLTEEWLERFGIDYTNEEDWYDLTFTIKGLLFETASSMEGFTYNIGFDDQINIKYVHQLQNLYFALTGEELTIKSE